MASFRFIICPVLSSTPVGEIDLTDVTFTESVDGKGTTLNGNAVVSNTQSAAKLKDILGYPGNPRNFALYVKNGDQYLWGGVIQTRVWNPGDQAFAIQATSWKAWLYQIFVSANSSANPVTDVKWSFTNTDQFAIAKSLVIGNTGSGKPGTPVINVGVEMSGVLRDLNIFGSEFVYVGDAIDRMANREKGFEWDITILGGADGNPYLLLELFYPKRQQVNSSVLFESTESGGNITKSSNLDDSSENVITRVWGTGSGSAGADLLMTHDSDPNLAGGNTLLVESKEYANTSTTQISTIASHVQGIRKFHSSGLQQVTVNVPLDLPSWEDYFLGNKVRLIIKDEVLDLDFQSVRIVRRTFKLNASGENPAEDSVDVLIDLNDTDLPQDETAV